MDNRLVMNSKSLQEHFPQVYRDFFSKCPIVVSAPRHFCWTGSYTSWFGGVSLAQKLPLRTYIGLETNNSGKVSIINGYEFDNLNNSFRQADVPLIQKDEMEKFIKFYLNKLHIRSGINISFLTELPLSGPGIYGAFSISLAAAILLQYNKITTDQLIQFSNSEAITENLHKDLLKLAWKIESIGYYQPSLSSLGVCATFYKSQLPIINWSEPIDKDWGDIKSIEEFDDFIDRRQFLAVKLEKLLNKSQFEWPIDFALICGNSPRKPSSGMRGIYNIFDRNRDNYQMIAKTIFSEKYLEQEIANKIKSLFDSKFNKDNYIDFAKILSFNMIAMFKNLFEKDSFEESTVLFIDSVNKEYDSFALGGLLYPELQKIKDVFANNLSDKPFKVGFSMSSAGQRNDLLIVGSCKIFTDYIDEILSAMSHNNQLMMVVDYASWIDGIEEEGIKVEQHLAEGIRSKFISQGSVSLKKYNLEGAAAKLSSLEKLEKEKETIDLLIDAVEEKIYVKGEKLTSKQLHSTSATIEILQVLLENIGKGVVCSNLPESAYNRDRNEMQSKIVTPLIKIIKQKTNKKLPMVIFGGLTDFYLKLEPSELDIRVIEKVF